MGLKYFVFFCLILLIICSVTSCLTFRIGDNATLKRVKKFGIDLSVRNFQKNGITIRYFQYQNPNENLPLLLLIHGAPGSSSNFTDFLKYPTISQNYSVLLIDRLGYGFSNYGKYATIKVQAESIISLLDTLVKNDQDVFVAGHSYGGTIAAAIAGLNPDYLTASVLMAPALDPDNEKYFWFGKLGVWKATRWMASGALKVATDEKYNHAEELKFWDSKWKDIETPVLHIHGNKDKVVPFINLTYFQKKMREDLFESYEWKRMNHFFPFTETKKTIEIIHFYFQKQM